MYISIIVSVIFLIFAAFFSGSEVGFISVDRHLLKYRNKQNKNKSRFLRQLIKFTESYENVIYISLIGTNISIIASVQTLSRSLHHNFKYSYIFLSFVYPIFTLIIAEIIPKLLYSKKPYTLLKLSIVPYSLLYYLFFPIIIFFKAIDLVLKKFTKNKIDKDEENLSNERFYTYLKSNFNLHTKQNSKLLDNIISILKLKAFEILEPVENYAHLIIDDEYIDTIKRINYKKVKITEFIDILDNDFLVQFAKNNDLNKDENTYNMQAPNYGTVLFNSNSRNINSKDFNNNNVNNNGVNNNDVNNKDINYKDINKNEINDNKVINNNVNNNDIHNNEVNDYNVNNYNKEAIYLRFKGLLYGINDYLLIFTKENNLVGYIKIDNDLILNEEIVIKKPIIIPFSRKLDGILDDLKKEDEEILFVIDEYDSVEGIIKKETIFNKLYESILEGKEDINKVKKVNYNEYIIDCSIELNKLNKLLGFDLKSEYYRTLNGFIQEQIGKIPEIGEIFKLDKLIITIIDANEKVINKVKLKKT